MGRVSERPRANVKFGDVGHRERVQTMKAARHINYGGGQAAAASQPTPNPSPT